MPPRGVFKITNISEDRVPVVVADFELDDPTSIEKIDQKEKNDQGKNLWTVVATFPGDGEIVKNDSK